MYPCRSFVLMSLIAVYEPRHDLVRLLHHGNVLLYSDYIRHTRYIWRWTGFSSLVLAAGEYHVYDPRRKYRRDCVCFPYRFVPTTGYLYLG